MQHRPGAFRRKLSIFSLVAILGACGGSSHRPSSTGISSVTATCVDTTQVAGLSDQCSATVHGTGNFDPAVTWQASAGTISSTGLFTTPLTATVVTITATSVADRSKSASVTVTVTPPPSRDTSGFTYNGFTHTSFQSDEYNNAAALTSQDALADTGVNWAGVLVTQYQANATATSIAPAPQTPTDASVIAAIQEFHRRDLAVMLKPHVDALSGEWRGTFQPANVDAWFASFTAFITHYARMAQTNNVEMLCVGTEFVQLSGSANRARWTAVIRAVRSVYRGRLLYAANATFGGDEFTSVSFWDQMDVIGLDAYFPLTDHNDPGVAALVASWNSNASGFRIVAAIQNFAAAHPRQPVIFSEVGYRSVAGANRRPYDFSMPGAVDNTEQQDCYEALYEVWSPHVATLKGIFWWSWSVPPPTATDTDYTPWTKPAEIVLKSWQ